MKKIICRLELIYSLTVLQIGSLPVDYLFSQSKTWALDNILDWTIP